MDLEARIAAFVDGELAPTERAAFEAEMTADQTLAAAVARQQRLRVQLSAAYAPVLDEPVPLRLSQAAMAANDAGARRAGPRPWAAMAACLVVGVVAGRLVLPAAGPVATERGVLVARGELARTLDHGLAADIAPIRVGLTFRDRTGRYCRTFQSTSDRLAGVACRTDTARWATQTLTGWTPLAQTTYRTAGAKTPPAVLAAVDALIQGEPLDAQGEQAARARGWRR